MTSPRRPGTPPSHGTEIERTSSPFSLLFVYLKRFVFILGEPVSTAYNMYRANYTETGFILRSLSMPRICYYLGMWSQTCCDNSDDNHSKQMSAPFEKRLENITHFENFSS